MSRTDWIISWWYCTNNIYLADTDTISGKASSKYRQTVLSKLLCHPFPIARLFTLHLCNIISFTIEEELKLFDMHFHRRLSYKSIIRNFTVDNSLECAKACVRTRKPMKCGAFDTVVGLNNTRNCSLGVEAYSINELTHEEAEEAGVSHFTYRFYPGKFWCPSFVKCRPGPMPINNIPICLLYTRGAISMAILTTLAQIMPVTNDDN